MPYKTQLEKHLEEVKYEIAQEFGLTKRRDLRKSDLNFEKKDFSFKRSD